MIAFFPDVYPDELVYSWLARYGVRSGYSHYRAIADDLFTSNTAKPNLEFFMELSQDEIKAMTSNMSLENIILKHTMFPYYARFLPAERRQKAFRLLINMDKSFNDALYSRRFKTQHRQWLRYCPICAEDDRSRYGETYWHRLHQLDHVDICPAHGCRLHDSTVSITSKASPSLIHAEIVIPESADTKGFDAEFKVTFALILRRLVAVGTTILMVSHDVPFCAEYAHKCGLFFDGSIVAEGTPREFFSGNSFYTTPANRMARHLIPKAVTVSDIIGCCGSELPVEPEIPEITILPEPKETAVNFKPKPLPVWRKALAGASLAVALLVFFFATSITDLSKLINAEGISSSGHNQLKLYIVLIAALGVFLAAIGRRSAPSAMLLIPAKQRKLSKRTMVATVLILLFIPLTIFAGVMYLGNQHYNITAFLVLIECMLPFFLVFESRKPKARELVTIAVLCAIGVAGRSAFFMLPQFKPVLALVIISGVAFGGETGFLVGAVTMMVSNVLFSQGPWMPWQMFSMGIIGFLAGVCFRKGLLRRSRGSLATFGAFAAVIIYGGIMNPAAALMYNSQIINLQTLMAYYVSGLPMDLIHAAATVIFLLIAAEPMLEKLDRIKVKYGLVE